MSQREKRWSSGATHPHLRRQGHVAVELSYGGGPQLAWRTRRHFIDHVAGIEVAGAGGDFGPFPG